MIITDVGDIRSLFGDRIRIVPPRDTGALAAAMEAAAVDPSPQADYEDVIRRVSIEAVAGAILDALLKQQQ
jgi:glycosyltransferase involved in cell wall biosynthesis